MIVSDQNSLDASRSNSVAASQLCRHARLRRGVGIALGIQIILMLLALTVSSVLQEYNNRLNGLAELAAFQRIKFQHVRLISQRLSEEITSPNSSVPYVRDMQSKLSGKLDDLQQSIDMPTKNVTGVTFFDRKAEERIAKIWADISPFLTRFMERNRVIADASPDEISKMFLRPVALDLTLASNGFVVRSLDEIFEIAKRMGKDNSVLLFRLNIAINVFSILMIGIVGLFIIFPTLRRQFMAIHREQAILNDLQDKVFELQVAENKTLMLYGQARAASKAKTEFLAVVSHELRTPLNAINGFSEIMSQEMFGPHAVPQYLDYSKSINESGEHLLSLINEILDFSRLDLNELELSETTGTIREVIEKAVAKVEHSASASGITLKVQASDVLDSTVTADQPLLRLALSNLLCNAIKFSQHGSEVRIRCERRNQTALAFVVEDDGIGIDAERIPELLGPFIQTESAFARENGGLGLGLAISRSVMLAHGGEILISSQPGAGTCAMLLLPGKRVEQFKGSLSDSSSFEAAFAERPLRSVAR